MDVNKIKDGDYTWKEVEEEFKEVDNESIKTFMNCLDSIVREREEQNKGLFIGWVEAGDDDDYSRYYIRLGKITEAEARDWVKDQYHGRVLNAGYQKVGIDMYRQFGLCRDLDHVIYELGPDVSEELKNDIVKYHDELRSKLSLKYHWEHILDDASNENC